MLIRNCWIIETSQSRSKTSITSQSIFCTYIQFVNPGSILQELPAFTQPCQSDWRVHVKAVYIRTGRRSTIHCHVYRRLHHIIIGIIRMCIKVHPVPIIRISQKTTSDSLNTSQSLVEVITCVTSFTCIIFIFCRQHLPTSNCIQFMDIIESLLIISVQV